MNASDKDYLLTEVSNMRDIISSTLGMNMVNDEKHSAISSALKDINLLIDSIYQHIYEL